jgi:hypothetical protein
MFDIHEAVERVSMKGPLKIQRSSSLMDIRLIRDDLTIKLTV